MILVIDNYDSFTFNLVQYIGELGGAPQVHRNDQIDIGTVESLNPDGIVISPGPGRPENAGISVALIKKFAPSKPILGICLGHQAIGLAFGGKVIQAPKLMHGKTSEVFRTGNALFSDLPNPFVATRYHSLIVQRKELPQKLRVTAETEDKVIMGLQHRDYPTFGVQFHPESILTPDGKQLLNRFIGMCGARSG